MTAGAASLERQSARRRTGALDAGLAALAGVLALAVYVRSLAPGLLWGDSAEFQFAAWLGGFAHPTGYPLYLMLGWLWTHLVPLRDPAFRMNLFSALWGGVAVAVLYLVVVRLLRFVDTAGGSRGVSRIIAFGAVLVFVFTPTFWSQAVITEVYTLHAAFVSALLLALLLWAERVFEGDVSGARRRSYLVALLLGLSLAHHRSTILLIPAAALFVAIVLLGTHSRVQLSFRRVALLLVCLLAPLLLYLYVPLRAPHVAYYRVPLAPGNSLPLYDSTLGGFLAHVSGSVFSSSLTAPRAVSLEPGQVAGRFADELSANGLLLGAFGLLTLLFLAIRGKGARAWAVLGLTGLFFVAQVLFNLVYAIGDIYVFYIPAYLVWVLWMSIGAWGLVQAAVWLFAGQGEKAQRWSEGISAVLVFAVLLAFAYHSAVIYWPKVQRAGDDSALRAWDALLRSDIPENAILVTNDRDEMVPFWYLALVEGRGTKLTGLFPLIRPGPEWKDVGRVTDAALATGRPVYLVKPMPGMEVKYDLSELAGQPTGPLGPAVRVAPLAPPSPAHKVDLMYGDAVRLRGYDVTPDPLVPGQPAQVTLYWQPLREMIEDWTTFVQVVSGAGDKAGQSDHHPGGVFYPTNLWAVGEQLRDTHTLTVAPGAAPGSYQLVVGLYLADASGLRQLGSPQAVGAVEVSR